MKDDMDLYDVAIKRIHQLEDLNQTLAAQIDRMTPVISAAQGYGGCDQYGWDKTAARQALIMAVHTYEQQMAALAKGTGE